MTRDNNRKKQEESQKLKQTNAFEFGETVSFVWQEKVHGELEKKGSRFFWGIYLFAVAENIFWIYTSYVTGKTEITILTDR